MADAISRLISELQTVLPTVCGEARAQWNSKLPFTRAVIRDHIAKTLPDLRPEDMQMLADLKEPPRPFHWSVSVSHCPSLGGWIAAPRPAQIGFDVELKSRIQLDIVQRVSTSDELERAPEASFLWVAKEAFFKALEDEQPQVLSQVTILDWRALNDGLWSWQGVGAHNGTGFLVTTPTELIAGALII